MLLRTLLSGPIKDFFIPITPCHKLLVGHPIYSRVSAHVKHGRYWFSLFLKLCLVSKYKYCYYSQPSIPILHFTRSLHKWNSSSHKLLVFNVLLPFPIKRQYLHILKVAGTASPLTRICTFHVLLTHVWSSNPNAVSTPNHHAWQILHFPFTNCCHFIEKIITIKS